MLKRKIELKLSEWLNSSYGLLVDGARQIGKTYSIEKFINEHFENVIEINLYENKKAVPILSQAVDSNDFLLRLTTLIDKPLIKGKTVIFLDEIQEFKDFDIITMLKFLIQNNNYRFVISGSLLGVEQYGVDSWPEGYMILEKMYPLDFEEFLWAAGISDDIIKIVKNSFLERTLVPDYIHDKLMYLFRKYLLVGGMPKAVQSFFDTNDFNVVSLDHKAIESYISKDVIKYASENDKLLIKTMYELLPSELNSQSKRFSLKDLPKNYKNENLHLSFGWFTKAGIAIPVYNVSNIEIPLELSSNHKLVKLFHEDVGILTYLIMDSEMKRNILNDGTDINFGSIYENCVAQMLTAAGNESIYYFSKNGIGEIDFLLQKKGQIYVIEVKSGKDYKRHSAINNIINKYPNIDNVFVLYNGNVFKDNKIVYLPVYMGMLL